MHRPAFLAALLLAAPFANAWGGQGHQVVALIAQIHLTPAAKAAVTDMLGSDVHIYDAEIASWADQVRRTKGYTQTAGWHFVDIPAVAGDTFDEERDGEKGANVVDKITDELAIVSDKSKSKDERAEALKWVVHLVGDSTQPLHCAERNKDRGGNSVDVWMPGSNAKKPTNLHSVWDSGMLTKWIGKTEITDYAQGLDDATKPDDGKAMAAGTPTDWANESHKIAVDVVYKGIPADGGMHLTQDYVDAAKPVVEKQLERGGVRLAMLLNRALTK